MNFEYKLIKLITKENIITQINPQDSEGRAYLTLHNTYEIKSFLNPQNGEFSTTLIDWLNFSTDDFTKVAVNDIITVNEPNQDLVDHYQMILNNKKFQDDINEEVDTASTPADGSVSLDETEEISQDDFLEMLVKHSNKTIH
jgi:hypothetical protein